MHEGEPSPAVISKAELNELINGFGDDVKGMASRLSELNLTNRVFEGVGEPVEDSGRRAAPPTNMLPHSASDKWGGATGALGRHHNGQRFMKSNDNVGDSIVVDNKWWVVVYERTDIAGQIMLCVDENEFKALA